MPKRRLTQLVLTADVLVIGRHHDTVEASIPEAAVNSCLDLHRTRVISLILVSTKLYPRDVCYTLLRAQGKAG